MPPGRVAVYAASAGMLVLTFQALRGRVPPVPWAVAALACYVVLILAGVLALSWRVFVDAIVRGPRGARGVVLTFDDGPHPRWTPRVLETLNRHGATATFFVVGRKAEEHPDIVRTILSHGHEVQLHSYAHDRLFALRSERRVREDLELGVAAIERVTGRRPMLFRPPIGHTNPIVARVARALDLTVVGWTIGARDGIATARPEDVVARVQRDLRDGAIVLLHDAPERGDREPAAVRALPAILDAIAAGGLQVVPLATWIDGAQEGAAGSTT
jgi:peptidoglycan/xylan/chitin deacetylase (PgdA/CDA1 family)